MPSWVSSELGLWLLAATALAAALALSRLDLRRAGSVLGWTAFAAFAAGALVWMFRDTYAHYYAQKQDALRLSYWGSYPSAEERHARSSRFLVGINALL